MNCAMTSAGMICGCADGLLIPCCSAHMAAACRARTAPMMMALCLRAPGAKCSGKDIEDQTTSFRALGWPVQVIRPWEWGNRECESGRRKRRLFAKDPQGTTEYEDQAACSN